MIALCSFTSLLMGSIKVSELSNFLSFFISDDDDEDEDDTEALLAELEQIKKERAEEKLRKVKLFLLIYPSFS